MPSSWRGWRLFDPKLLHPVEHRSLERQQDLNLVHTRSRAGAGPDHARSTPCAGWSRAAGGRLPACSTRIAFPGKACIVCNPGGSGHGLATPLLEQIRQMNRRRLAEMDRQIEKLVCQVSGDRSAAHRAWRGPDRRRQLCADAGSAEPDAASNRSAGALSRPASRGSKASRATQTRSGASPRPATVSCAACWCSRRNTSWAASAPIPSCAAGD
jgi:hypothetical protein